MCQAVIKTSSLLHVSLVIKAMFGCCKTFSGKYIFSENTNFRKRKMFPCVWLHFKKFSGKYFLVFGKEEGKHKSKNTSHNPEKKKKIINDENVSSSTTAVRSRSEIAIDGAITISPSSRDRDRQREIAKARSRSTARSRRRSRSRIAIDGAVVGRCSMSSLMIFFWVVACVFQDLCFPSSFPNTRKHFPEIFLKCNQTPWKHFPFPEISISGKYVFSGSHFTVTKHSLIIKL